MNLGQRYRGSNGVRAYRVEDGALGNLAPPGDLEESASHHQRWPTPTLLWMWRWANMILTGITLRQYRSLLYELLMAQGNIFQHCASAREFGVQIGDLECGEAI